MKNLNMKQWKGVMCNGIGGEKQYEWKNGNAGIWGLKDR